jgi:hypothetical protein
MKYLLVPIFVRLYYKSHCSLPLFCVGIIAIYAKAVAVITFLELRIQNFTLRCDIMQHVSATDCSHGYVQGDANNVKNKSPPQLKWLRYLVRKTVGVRQTSVPGGVFPRWFKSLPLFHVSASQSTECCLFFLRTFSSVYGLKSKLIGARQTQLLNNKLTKLCLTEN